MKKTIQKIPKILPVLILFVLFSLSSMAQNSLSGTVTDSKSGAPASGVTVTIKGTKTSTQTAADGTFKLSAPAGKKTLLFTSVGFATQESTSTDGTFKISLVQTNQVLNEVVVVGYGTTRKKDLTGAVTTVSSKDFQKGVITTPEQLIAGKVPGVSVISGGGRPGQGGTIRIRGGASLNASNDPLIVVDGIPLDNDGIKGAVNSLSLINPNDIETFTVLKDASAAAIYGTRAANGVILITTKKGKAGGDLKVSFSTLSSWSKISDKVDVLSADQVRGIINGLGNTPNDQLLKSQLGTANTDWQDVIYRTAASTDNNLSFSGGIKKLPYRLSLGYSYINGVLVTDNLERFSGSLSLNPSFFHDYLKVSINLKATSEKSRQADDGAIANAVAFDPTQPVYSGSPRYGGYFEWLENNGNPMQIGGTANPLGLLEEQSLMKYPKRSIGNIQFDYKFHFLPDLHANLNLGYDVSKGTENNFTPDSAVVAYKVSDPYIGGNSYFGKQRKRSSLLDFYLNYVKNITGIKSRIDVTAGYSYNNYLTTNYNYRSYTAHGDTIPGTTAPDYALDKPEHTLIGIFGRLNFVARDKYMLTATVRRDGSSRFIKKNHWGTFPSVALGWKLKDDFFRASRVISDLKLRVGWGVTGQQDGIGNYAFLSNYFLTTPQSSVGMGNTYLQAYYPTGFNSDLKWESTTTYNAALDYGLFNNRINGSVDFYFKKTKDLLNEIPQPAGTNFSAIILANVGDMENRGVEFNLNLQVIRKKDVTLDINFNATYNKNEITNLTVKEKDPNYVGAPVPGSGAGGVQGVTQINSVGSPRNTFYLFHQIYDKDGKPIEGLFEDINRDGIINDKDKYKGHSSDPSVFYGFSANLSVKRFNLGFVMRANFNNYVYNDVYSNFGRLNSVAGAYHVGNASTNYLDTRFAGSTDIQTLSDYYIQNASFLKMDNINIGYNIGRIGKTNHANLRLTAVLQNVFTITKYKGLDPEISNGIDQKIYPRPRTISVGANIDF